MNKHDKISRLLAASALGELSPEAQSEVETHLNECTQCSRELKRLKTLLECTGRISELSPDAKMCESAKQAVFTAVENEQEQTSPRLNAGLEPIWRTIMYRKKMKYAAAVIAIVVLGGISFWPGGSPQNEWWLGSPAAWGQEIMAELEKIEALVYRGQSVHVGRYGSTHVSGTWSRNYEAKDRSREDRYYEHTDEDTFGDNNLDNSILQHVTYKVPEGQDLVQYGVSYEHQCYTIRTIEGGAYQRDPMKRLQSYVKQLDKADRILDTATFEGRECVGFEVSAYISKDEPAHEVNRIWFDVETKLPVRIEMHGRPNSQPGQTHTFIHDQFEYYAQVPAEMFEPEIPENFINAEPGEVHAAKEKQEKGHLPYADDVPAGLKDEIAAALKSVKTTVYRERFGFVRDENWLFTDGERIYISEYDWRKDSYSGQQLQKTEWYVTDKADWGKTSFDFNDKNFKLIQTTVNFGDRSYKEITHGSKSHPNNPMDHIIFLVGFIDRADRFFENQLIDGIECFGFELSAKKYGSNPDTSIHTLWFDTETMLPVKMEHQGLQDDGPRKMLLDQFEWDAELPAETFIPEIPADFRLQADSDG